jgi:hypothetical protein
MIDAPTLEALTTEERAELEQLEAVIDRNFIEMGEALQQIKQSGLYREYGTWEAYCHARWSKTARRIDQLIQGSLLAAHIQNIRSDLPDMSSEYQARALTGLSVEEAAQVWDETTKVYGDKPTAAQVETTRERLPAVAQEIDPDPIKRMVYASGISQVIQRMNKGELTPQKALNLCDTITACMPKVRGDMLMLGIFDEPVIRRLDKLFKQGRESYDEIVLTGFLQFEDEEAVKIKEATLEQLTSWLNWKSTEHRKIAFADKLVRDRYEAKIIDVDDNCIEFRIPGIQHDLKEGDRVLVTIVRV